MLSGLALFAAIGAAAVGAAGDAATARIAIGDARVVEGSKGATRLVFPVTLSGPVEGEATVKWKTMDGTAVAPGDYTSTSGTLTLTSTSRRRTIVVPVVADTVHESNERVRVMLLSPTNATLSHRIGVGTIIDDDAPAAVENTIAAAGDIACRSDSASFKNGEGTPDECRQKATSDLLIAGHYDAVLPLGDLQYEDGTAAQYAGSYAPSWGRVKAITRPTPGNHDYHTSGAAGYYDYFGSLAGDRTKGYYSYDLGAWHLIALNSNCSDVPCSTGSPQEQWLRADLAATKQPCILAYWHHPRFSSGTVHGSSKSVQPFFQALYDAHADIVLQGHEHNYERFAPSDPNGVADPNGIRSFVVGTGGKTHYPFGTPLPNSEVRNATSFGILELKLGATGYTWRFVPAPPDTFTDTGSGTCH